MNTNTICAKIVHLTSSFLKTRDIGLSRMNKLVQTSGIPHAEKTPEVAEITGIMIGNTRESLCSYSLTKTDIYYPHIKGIQSWSEVSYSEELRIFLFGCSAILRTCLIVQTGCSAPASTPVFQVSGRCGGRSRIRPFLFKCFLLPFHLSLMGPLMQKDSVTLFWRRCCLQPTWLCCQGAAV